MFHNNKCILKQTEQHHYPQKSLKRKSLGGLCNYSFWRIDSKQTLGRPVSDGHWERWGEKNPVCFIRPPGLPRVPSRCCCCVCLGSSAGPPPYCCPVHPPTGRCHNPAPPSSTLLSVRDRNDLEVQESHVTSPGGWCNASVNRSYCNRAPVQRGSSVERRLSVSTCR